MVLPARATLEVRHAMSLVRLLWRPMLGLMYGGKNPYFFHCHCISRVLASEAYYVLAMWEIKNSQQPAGTDSTTTMLMKSTIFRFNSDCSMSCFIGYLSNCIAWGCEEGPWGGKASTTFILDPLPSCLIKAAKGGLLDWLEWTPLWVPHCGKGSGTKGYQSRVFL